MSEGKEVGGSWVMGLILLFVVPFLWKLSHTVGLWAWSHALTIIVVFVLWCVVMFFAVREYDKRHPITEDVEPVEP